MSSKRCPSIVMGVRHLLALALVGATPALAQQPETPAPQAPAQDDAATPVAPRKAPAPFFLGPTGAPPEEAPAAERPPTSILIGPYLPRGSIPLPDLSAGQPAPASGQPETGGGEAETEAEAEAETEAEAEAERIVWRPIVPDSDEERDLAEIYAGEDSTLSAADRNEYKDAQTADEDRPMLPAIRAERGRGQRRGRVSGRERSRRERRPKSKRGGRERQTPNPDVGADASLLEQIGEIVADAGDRSIGIKQIISALRRDHGRQVTAADVKRAVLAETNMMARHQLSPRVVFRDDGRLTSGTPEGSQLAAALVHFEEEARTALAHKLGRMSSNKLEVVAQLWLEHCGFRDLEWVKRVRPSSYALALAPEQSLPTLVSVRSGGKPVDRRGVGELRAGVTAKNLSYGMLIAPQPLSAEALAELATDGPPIVTLCGPALTRSLCDAGIGTSTRTYTVRILDERFFASL